MNKDLLDIAIERLESLRDKGLERVQIDTTDGRQGEFNLSIDIDFYEKPKMTTANANIAHQKL